MLVADSKVRRVVDALGICVVVFIVVSACIVVSAFVEENSVIVMGTV